MTAAFYLHQLALLAELAAARREFSTTPHPRSRLRSAARPDRVAASTHRLARRARHLAPL